ncbi:MAG: protein tyrosine phosphatase family protein [Longimicrobiales bacterium]
MNAFRIASTLPIVALAAAPLTAQTAPAPLETVRNFQIVDETLSSAGQIAYDQIPLLAEEGYEVVVNVHIPVDWERPELEDVEMFFDVMQANEGRHVFVHCFANMRASAFVYMYRTLVEGVPEEEARATMNEVWDPGEMDQWSTLIRQAQAELRRN